MNVFIEWFKRAVQRLATSYHAARNAVDDFLWQYGWVGGMNRRRLDQLRNTCLGKRCFVIGNGPSLTIADLRCLRNEISIGCNGLFLFFKEMGYLPTFYTVEDSLVAEDRAEQINSIRGTTKIFPRKLAYCLKQDKSTIYVNFSYDYDDFPKFSGQFEKVVFWGGTVTFLNLQLAYYLGCSEVYLIGTDHNYQVLHEVGKGGVIMSTSADINHFHPEYFGPGFRYHDPKVERMEKAYRAALEFASKNGMKIFNATRGGKLEVFPRVEFERLFE